jgi:magnesium transporter
MKKILQKMTKNWVEKHPEEVAKLIDTLSPSEKKEFFRQFSPAELAPIIHFMNPAGVALTLNEFSPKTISDILETIPTKKSFLIFQQLSAEIRHQLDAHLSHNTHKQFSRLVAYPHDSIGLLINPQVMTLKKEQAVRDVIKNIRRVQKTAADTLYYLYVTDETDRLIGVVSIRDLLISEPSTGISSIMNHNVISVQATQIYEEVVPIIRKNNFVALPVVDEERHFLGVVQQSDILPMMEAEASDDIQKIFGAGEDERVFSSPLYSIRKRFPWLNVNLFLAFLTALVVGSFESTIAQLTTLAVLMPIVASQSGNTGAQTLAVIIRGLALGEVHKGLLKKIVLKEMTVGFINGLMIALIAGSLVFLWMHDIELAIIIGISIIAGATAAVCAGALIPILLKSLGHDPAQASSIILTTITDVIGFGGFLLLASIMLKS